MRFRILGPVRVWNGSSWTPVAALQQRLLLATLLVDAGQVVSTQRLVYEVWGERPPRTALKTVHAYVMRLRRLLGGDGAQLLATRDHGYELAIGRGDLDAWEFERLVASGRSALAAGRPEPAAALLAEALALWHGPVLADVPEHPAWTALVAQLDRGRLAATEDRLAALLELDRYAEAAGELQRLVEEHPLRERLWALLMRAQWASGRRADALASYRRACHVLREELGLEPGTELRQLQREILAEEPPPVARAATPPAVVPAQLPADVNGFTGRDRYLEDLDARLPAGDDPPATAVAVSVIAGTAGAGKTALAVHWAHRVRDRFPDGQLYVNLRGYADAPPVQPVEALARFLRALGVPPDQTPSDPDEAAALYRGSLAGRRVLVLLDNAGAPDQVRPLLPASPGCLALVTSRDRLDGLVARDGAVPLALGALTEGEARELLARALGAGKVDAEPEAAAELARLCGQLPLALRIAAANLSARPHASIAEYAGRLSRDRIASLEVDGDPQAAVRAAFDLSYTALPDDARRLFRLLGLVPGPDFTAPASAALMDSGLTPAVRLLERLSAAHLVGERTAGRYALHDLLRSYAAQRVAAEESGGARDAALHRLYGYYQDHVDAAAAVAYPSQLRLPAQPGTSFASDTAALTWLGEELPNLVAAVRTAAAQGPYETCWRLADGLRGYFFLRTATGDWEVVAGAARTAGAAANHPSALAAAYLSLGLLESVLGRAERSIEYNLAAAAHARRAGWAEAEAASLANVGGQYTQLGRLREAADYCTRALAMHRQTGWEAGQANQLGNLGLIYYRLGRLELAYDHGRQAAELYQRLGSAAEQARVSGAVGVTYHAMGRLDEAATVLTGALAVHSVIGDRLFYAYTLVDLAELKRDRDGGHLTEARPLAEEALAVALDLSDGSLEAAALAAKASIHQRLGDPASAIADNQRALRLTRQAGDRFSEADVLARLADAYRAVDRHDRAREYADQALALAREHGYRLLEGKALAVLAAIGPTTNEPGRAGWVQRGFVAAHALR
jgi:DNA-binding SARP family transcriptional activator